eukprot:6186551-Prymnesium_polylepis.1
MPLPRLWWEPSKQKPPAAKEKPIGWQPIGWQPDFYDVDNKDIRAARKVIAPDDTSSVERASVAQENHIDMMIKARQNGRTRGLGDILLPIF